MGRRAAGLILGVLCLVVAGAVLADIAGSWRYHDLWCFYHGGEAALHGLDPYDGPTWSVLTDDPSRSAGSRVVKAPCPGAFGYPYWSALAFAPLALVPYDVAAGVWGALLLAGLIGGVTLLARATAAPGLLLAAIAGGSLPLIQTLVFGQVTGVLLPLLGLSLLAPAGRAGTAAALLYLKPQLGALYVPALMRRTVDRGGPRLAWSAVVTIALLVTVSVAAFPAWPGEWLRELTTTRVQIARPLPTAAGLATLLFGDARFAVVLIGAVLVGLALVTRRRAVGSLEYAAIAMGVSLFAVPYAYSYDHLFLLLPWAVVGAEAARSEPGRRRRLLAALVFLAIILPFAIFVVTFDSGSDTLNAVIPALSPFLVAGSCPRGATMDT